MAKKPPTPKKPSGLAQALPKPVAPKPKTGGQRGDAPRPEEYPRPPKKMPSYPTGPERTFPPGTPRKKRSNTNPPQPGYVPPKKKAPTTTTTVPKAPGVAQKKKK